MKSRITTIAVLVGGVLMQPALAATPQNWTTSIDAATYGVSGSIVFNDWGYTGPTGVGANDFVVTSPVTGVTGFDASRIGQQQNVHTLPADGITPDPATHISTEFSNDNYYRNAGMDGQTNFYDWGYTTPESNFYNMQIDRAGNYYVPQAGMRFGFYDQFNYINTVNPTGPRPNQTVDSLINFQPYGISDGKGWCGSVLADDASGVAVMAGQVTFDVAFAVYFGDADPAQGDDPNNIQLIPDFVMRSYGSYSVNLSGPGLADQVLAGSAVMNNTNPGLSPLDPLTGAVDPNTPALDAAYNNRVSFLGAGVIPNGVWISADSLNADGSRRLDAEGRWDVTIVDEGTAGATWHTNYFYGRSFMLRADGERIVTFVGGPDRADWTDYDPAYYSVGAAVVPVPAAAWLFGSGLLGLVGVARRRKV